MGLRAKPSWEHLPEPQLLKIKLCQLDLSFEASPLYRLFQQAKQQLHRRGLRFEPHAWLSTGWFTPDGSSGIALPFYLAHPRLRKLDRKQMKGTIAETPTFCRKAIRHELGHAVENAFLLRDLPEVQKVFGPSTRRYPRTYAPRLYSRRFVNNLGQGYAQSHPDEDFAETFAVWLTPRKRWLAIYRDRPALEKLLFLDRLMKDLRGQRPKKISCRTLDPLHRISYNLETYYRRQRRYFLEAPAVDRSLRNVFGAQRGKRVSPRAPMPADVFLRKIKPRLSHQVSELSGEPKHRVNRVVDEMISRSRHLKLQVASDGPFIRDGVPPALTRYAIRFVRAKLYRFTI